MKTFLLFNCFVLLLSITIHAQTTVSGNVSGKWTKANSPYIISGGVIVPQNDTLIIQAGVEVRSSSPLDYINIAGTLLAKGTATDSVRFRGVRTQGGSSHGGSLRFESSSKNSQLEYISMDLWGDINYYGYLYDSSYPNESIYINSSGGVSITHSSIKNSEEYGITIKKGSNAVKISNNIFKDNRVGITTASNGIFANNIFTNNQTGIRIVGEGVSPIIFENSFVNTTNSIETYLYTLENVSNNVNASIVLLDDNFSKGSITLRKPGKDSYYKLNASRVYINSQDTLTIEAGVEIRSYSPRDVLHVYGYLIARGTVNDSIRFVGRKNATSNYGGYLDLSGKGGQLEYVSIDSLGYDEPYYGQPLMTALVIASDISIKNSTISNSAYHGIRITNQKVMPVIQNNKFANNGSSEIVAFVDNCKNISNNSNVRIWLASPMGIKTNSTLPFPGTNAYYFIIGEISVPQTYTLTIEPGVLIDFQDYGSLYVEGTLKAIGTELFPIRFVRLGTPSKDTYGGRVHLHSTSTNSQLSHILFNKLGSGSWYNYPALSINTSSVALSNISIFNSSNAGLSYSAAGSIKITSSNFYSNDRGVEVSNGSLVVDKCNIYGNVKYGINNLSATDTVDARNSYWGDESGPYHALLNPLGIGNQVSDKVKFKPWEQQALNGQTIIRPLQPIVTATSNSICAGAWVKLSSSACTGGINIWTDNSKGDSIRVSPSMTKSYKVVCVQRGVKSDSSAAVTITVNPNPQVSITPSVEVQSINNTLTSLIPNINGGTPTYSYLWTTNPIVNGNGSTSQNPIFGPFTTNTTIMLKVTDQNNCIANVQTSVVFKIILAIDSDVDKTEVLVYPNPSTDNTIKLKVQWPRTEALTFDLIDYSGNTIYTEKIKIKQGEQVQTLIFPVKEKGGYILRISGQGEAIYKRVVLE